MARPQCKRTVANIPQCVYFKPRAIPLSLLEEVILTVDECEAIRLADLEGMYQEEAANKMNTSRQTFGRIVDAAHKRVADALINGKALRIDGGNIELLSELMKRSGQMERCCVRKRARRRKRQ